MKAALFTFPFPAVDLFGIKALLCEELPGLMPWADGNKGNPPPRPCAMNKGWKGCFRGAGISVPPSRRTSMWMVPQFWKVATGPERVRIGLEHKLKLTWALCALKGIKISEIIHDSPMRRDDPSGPIRNLWFHLGLWHGSLYGVTTWRRVFLFLNERTLAISWCYFPFLPKK